MQVNNFIVKLLHLFSPALLIQLLATLHHEIERRELKSSRQLYWQHISVVTNSWLHHNSPLSLSLYREHQEMENFWHLKWCCCESLTSKKHLRREKSFKNFMKLAQPGASFIIRLNSILLSIYDEINWTFLFLAFYQGVLLLSKFSFLCNGF